MIAQGYPLFLAARASGTVWRIIGWDHPTAVCVLHEDLWHGSESVCYTRLCLTQQMPGEIRVSEDRDVLHDWADKN